MSETPAWIPPSGWVRVADRKWSPIQVSLGSTGALAIVWIASQFAVGTARFLLDEPWALWVGLGAAALLTMAASAAIVVLTPQALVDFDSSRLRVGRRTVELSELSWATLDYLDGKKKRVMVLRFGAGSRLKTGIDLRTAEGPVSPETRQRLAEVLRRSSVALPVSKDDPSGKFARYNFPGSLTKEDAMEVVLDPPGPGEALPVLGGTPVAERLRKLD